MDNSFKNLAVKEKRDEVVMKENPGSFLLRWKELCANEKEAECREAGR